MAKNRKKKLKRKVKNQFSQENQHNHKTDIQIIRETDPQKWKNKCVEGCENGLGVLDDNLYERSIIQWQFGDWGSLAQLNTDAIVCDSNRHKLALLAAVAHLQQGDKAEARRCIRLARDWGCDDVLIARFLVAGVHDCLGRAYTICQDQPKAMYHFKTALTVSSKNSLVELVAKTKMDMQTREFEETIKAWRNSKTKSVQDISGKEQDIHINLDALDAANRKIPDNDFINQSFDIESKIVPSNILVVLSTPRSGSTLLCDILRENDICLPHEYFQPFQYLPLLARRWGCVSNNTLDKEKYIRKLCEYRTYPNGWLGINLHGTHIAMFEKMRHLIGNCNTTFHYVHLTRHDIISQAVSFSIAEKTGCWTKHFLSDTKNNVEYDFDIILKNLRMIEGQNILIESYLKSQNINTINLVYEDFSNDIGYIEMIVARLLGHKVKLHKSKDITKQSSTMNTEWILKFQKDYVKSKCHSPSF